MSNYSRRNFCKLVAGSAASALALNAYRCQNNTNEQKPNMIVIFCDDLGYGDLSTFGHPTIHTPNLDKMASEGQKWTQFYVAASVCTPSRAGLMTGRLPIRNGMCSDKSRVLFPNSTGGLPEDEVTIAKALKPAGYKTACVGKWHLGHHKQYLPVSHGFDSYFGIPYSNDMDRINEGEYYESCVDPKVAYFNVPLIRDFEVIEKPADQTTITRRYTLETVDLIKKNKDNPFFIYLAHSMPHVPLFRSEEFKDKSYRGVYGDVIEEIDWSVGQILDTLRNEGLAENTLVVFTSDNGPWLWFKEHGGSAGPLRNGKGTTWDGGMREPTIFWWPGKIEPGMIRDLGSTLDLLPTCCKLAGVEPPNDRILDGYDLTPTLLQKQSSPRDVMFYYRGTQIFAVRKGAFKAHFITQGAYGGHHERVYHDPPQLYNLNEDPGESHNIADQHPEVIAEVKQIVDDHQAKLVPGKDQLAERI